MNKYITNHYREGQKRPKLCTEQFVLWEPDEKWNYAHHAQIIWFKGLYYVMFSSGRCNEDDTGQRVMYTVSEDYESWSQPEVLVDSMPGTYADAVLIPGCWHTDGNTLVAYYLSFEYTEDWLADGNRKPGSKGRMNWRKYQITSGMKEKLADFCGYYATEQEGAETIVRVYEDTGYVMDTHTAVAACAFRKYTDDTKDGTQTVIASTASPYKFTRSVMESIDRIRYGNMTDFELIDELSSISGTEVPKAIEEIRTAAVRHRTVCETGEMKKTVREFLGCM